MKPEKAGDMPRRTFLNLYPEDLVVISVVSQMDGKNQSDVIRDALRHHLPLMQLKAKSPRKYHALMTELYDALEMKDES